MHQLWHLSWVINLVVLVVALVEQLINCLYVEPCQLFSQYHVWETVLLEKLNSIDFYLDLNSFDWFSAFPPVSSEIESCVLTLPMLKLSSLSSDDADLNIWHMNCIPRARTRLIARISFLKQNWTEDFAELITLDHLKDVSPVFWAIIAAISRNCLFHQNIAISQSWEAWYNSKYVP